ncbi:MAG: DEAD/DEAH box helicase [Treponema sp.]|nr:DEAD/DEAH box helicase [Treponema sp.]
MEENTIIEDQIAESDENENQNEETVTFEDLGLDEYALKAVQKKGFVTPSPIQVLAIPRLLTGDTNLIARARTGTGKTAAFGLPIIQSIREKSNHVEALILEPTRELAVQTCEEMKSFSTKDFPRTTVLYGGASYTTQIRELKRGCEIVVGTPGRIKDHLERKTLDLKNIKYFILDEGDEMLDMGFIDDIREIFEQANPQSRILLFSATMPPPILKIAGDFMGEYDIIEEAKVIDEALLIEQKYWLLKESDKIEALVRLIDMSPDFYGLVFTTTKMDADRVTKELDMRGYEADALHGDIMQNQREKVLERFRMKKTRILVATDVAARGIDISGLSHVVNYSLPFDTATYVHRIGRTGRAGTTGIAVTFVRPEERRKLGYFIKNVERATKSKFTEEKVPNVTEVLAIKEAKLISDLKQKLFKDDEVIPVDTKFETLSESLCENQDAKKVLAGVLSVLYGNQLSPKHYGRISVKDIKARGDQMRIYVSLGKKDGYRAKEIAEFFANLLHIPGRLVDDIDVAQQFSLVSLPVKDAKKALELSKKNKKIPHMHVDAKEEGRGSRKSGSKSRKNDENKRKSSKPAGKSSSKSNKSEGKTRKTSVKADKKENKSTKQGKKSDSKKKNLGAAAYKKSEKKNVERF